MSWRKDTSHLWVAVARSLFVLNTPLCLGRPQFPVECPFQVCDSVARGPGFPVDYPVQRCLGNVDSVSEVMQTCRPSLLDVNVDYSAQLQAKGQSLCVHRVDFFRRYIRPPRVFVGESRCRHEGYRMPERLTGGVLTPFWVVSSWAE